MADITQPDNSLLALVPIQSRSPLRETLEWKTDILPSYNGTEESISVRYIPRQTFATNVSAQHDRAKDVFNTVYGGLARRWAVPVWPEAAHVGAVANGATGVAFDTRYGDWRAGSPALLIDADARWRAVYVDTVAVDGLTFAEPIEAMRNAFVVPVRIGRIIGAPEKRTSGYAADWSINYEVDDNIAFDVAAPEQYKGDDIYYEVGLLDNGSIPQQIVTSLETFDFEAGIVESFSPWVHNRTSRPHRIIATNAVEAWNLRLWLHRRAGRYRRFWQPSFEDDILLQQSGALASSIVVRTDARIPWALQRKHIAVKLRNGTWLPREITSEVFLTDTTVQLNLNASLATNSSQVEFISYLGLKRLDNDRCELNWIGNGHCETSVQVMELAP